MKKKEEISVDNNKKGSGIDDDTNYLKLENLQWTRVQCDLAHVHVPTALESPSADGNKATTKTNSTSPKNLLVVAKHLCGAGTDIALKSLSNTPTIGEPSAKICMATCCHGLCTWNEYVGRTYLRDALISTKSDGSTDNGNFVFGPNEFELMRRWTSGSVLHTEEDEDEPKDGGRKEGTIEHSISKREKPILTFQQSQRTKGKDSFSCINIASIVNDLNLQCGVQGLGRMCQRLIDYGRCEYIRLVLMNSNEKSAVDTTTTYNKPTPVDDSTEVNKNSTDHCDGIGGKSNSAEEVVVELCHYVKSDITPQNAVLIAYKRNKQLVKRDNA